MTTSTRLLTTLLASILPAAIAFLILFRTLRKSRENKRHPFKELVRRPAGERLRQQLEELDEKINYDIVWLLLFGPLVAGVLFLLEPQNPIVPYAALAISAGAAVLFGTRLSILSGQRSNHRLGYDGELYVAEELSRLIYLGFEIYHDVPFEGYNIDHIMAGSRGVFAVETKTRSKSYEKTGHQVVYDGQSLLWPKFKDAASVHQSRNNAKDLSAWLSAQTFLEIPATPILTIPGWFVTRNVPFDGLYVLNPEQIYNVVESLPKRLSPEQTNRVCQKLNEKCRVPLTG